jgi:hypothetical protein
MVRPLIAILALVSICSAQVPDSNMFISQTAGIRVSKPSHWQFAGLGVVNDNRDRIKFGDSAMQKAIKNANTPLVAMLKYPEPHPEMNPSFQIGVKPLGALKEQTEAQLWKLILPALARTFKDFKVVKEPKEIVLGGKKMSAIEISYVLEMQTGETYPCQSRMILWIKGEYLFQIGIGTANPPKPGDLEDIEAILASIKLKD